MLKTVLPKGKKKRSFMIKFLIDSASDISEKEATEMGVTFLPMIVNFGDEEYYDGITLMPHEFYNKLAESKDLPKTSQITPYRFSEAFQTMTEDGSEVIAITMSSRLSGTYNAAVQAASEFGGKVHVVDSYTVSAGERLLLSLALQRAKEGKTAQEIVAELNEKKHQVFIAATVDTLEYLKKGGRISSVSAILGGILNIKPLVKIVDGKVESIGKAHGKKKALLLLNEQARAAGGIDFTLPYAVIYTGIDEEPALTYAKNSTDVFPKNVEVRPQIIGCTIGTHVGPGAIGLAFFINQN